MTSTHKSRRIWFCQTEYVAEHPESLQKLKDAVGLTTIMPESPVCHTSGFSASAELAQRGPFEDWRRASRCLAARCGGHLPASGRDYQRL